MGVKRHSGTYIAAMLSAAFFVPSFFTPAFAATDTAVQADQSGSIETIVVTARKRSERLLDVPVSANALDREVLNRYATTTLTSLATQIPQVSIDHSASGSGAVITIRGIGSSAADAGVDQEVTVNIDDIPISRGRVVQQSMFDTESVEVLKGPQALYFGKNSPAGVIIQNSVDPGDTFEGYARIGIEANAPEFYGEAAASMPLADDLGLRLSIRGSDMTGGYIKDVAGPVTNPADLPLFYNLNHLTAPGAPFKQNPGDQDVEGRLTLKWTPSDHFDARFKFFYGQHNDQGDSSDSVILDCGPGQSHPMSLDLPTGAYLTDPYGTCNRNLRENSLGTINATVAASYPGSHGGVPFTNIPMMLSSLTMNYEVTPEITLTSTTGFYKYDQTQFSNYDYTVFALAGGTDDDHYEQWSQEIRAQSSFEGPVNVTAGFYYESTTRGFNANARLTFLGPDPFNGQWNNFTDVGHYTGKTYSLFGELNWKIAPNLELAGGARYTIEEKTGNEGNVFVHTFLPPGVVLPQGEKVIGAFTEHNVSPEVTLTWHPTEDTMIYAAYKEGFKSGGFSTPAFIPATATAQNQAFNEETARGYELGLKFSQLNNTLTGDVTAYHYIYSGLQIGTFNAAASSFFTQNAGSATTDGVEANVNYLVQEGLNVHGSVGYNRARYSSFPEAECWNGEPAPGVVLPGGITGICTGAVATGNPLLPYQGGTQNLAGMPVTRAPDWVAILGTTYETPVMSDWYLGLTADLRYSSGYYLSAQDSPFAYQGDYETLDASIRLHNDEWELAVMGRNLTDTVYGVLGQDKPLGPIGQTSGGLGLPRQIFVQATYHF